MKLDLCENCVYHLIHDEGEVSCYYSDDIVHIGILKAENEAKEVIGCPREVCSNKH